LAFPRLAGHGLLARPRDFKCFQRLLDLPAQRSQELLGLWRDLAEVCKRILRQGVPGLEKGLVTGTRKRAVLKLNAEVRSRVLPARGAAPGLSSRPARRLIARVST
jgi:hypothetical protein